MANVAEIFETMEQISITGGWRTVLPDDWYSADLSFLPYGTVFDYSGQNFRISF